jgi:hypothetical protein
VDEALAWMAGAVEELANLAQGIGPLLKTERETKVFGHEALQKVAVKLKAPDKRPTLEASQKAA